MAKKKPIQILYLSNYAGKYYIGVDEYNKLKKTNEELRQDIKQMLIVLKSLTPASTKGEEVLNKWIGKYKNE